MGFELELVREFVEDGRLAGVVLSNTERTLLIGLRRRDVVPGSRRSRASTCSASPWTVAPTWTGW